MNFFSVVNPKADFSKIEKEILKFWRENEIFRKSLENRKNAERFEFYDGPPFATGLPHYGHILAGTIKDVIPRFQTMRGKFVPRKWGWDCHGVPVEHQIEKKLGLKNRDDIEKIGIQKFNENCRGIVMKCATDWRKTVERMGRWVDLENDYKTMDPNFMESVMWVFAELFSKNLIYEGFKVVPYSPKLASGLSNFEANLNYKNITDTAITVAFELESGEKVLAWTTTPWTLPINLGLCVNPKIKYAKIQKGGEIFIVAENLAEKLFQKDFQMLETFSGEKLKNKKYFPLFPFFKNHQNAFRIFADDFVSDADGTGIVHLAPTGEDDARILQKNAVELFYPFSPDCHFSHENFPADLNGLYFRKDPTVENSEKNANSWVLKNLRAAGKIFREESLNHSYPHCWRTECALMYRGVKSFFVNIQKVKSELIAKNKEISWIPENIRDGRFGKILESAPDWAISRSRFWGSPIPVWKSKSGKMFVPKSVEEIAKNAEKKGGRIFFTRHGEATHNAKNIISTKISDGVKLTEKGKKDAEKLAAKIQNEKIDAIFCSPLLRARETAEILQKAAPDAEIIIDENLREIDAGKMDGAKIADWKAQFSDWRARYFENPHHGETSEMVGKRVETFLKKIREKYSDKNIIVVAHGEIGRHFWRFFWNRSKKEIIEKIPPTAKFYEFSFSARPENDRGELDLHRPWIDKIVLEIDGEKYFRVSDVLDCWFESGSMPYASTDLAKRKIAESREKTISPKILFLSGACGAGKTTISKLFEKENWAVLSGEEIFWELFDGKPVGDIREEVSQMHQEIIKRAKNLLKKGKNVVIETIVGKRNFQLYKKHFGEKMSIVILNPKKSVAVKRDKNSKKSSGKEKTEELWESFQHLKNEFGADNFLDNSDQNPAETFAKICEKINFKIENDFHPADFIAEGLDQTRGWFYTLHALGNALFHKPAFKNVIVNGIVLAEDGQKMSKSKQNFPDPNLIFEKYGADAMRFYLMNSPAVRAEDLRFSERGVAETLRKVFLPFWSAFSFFVTYANIDKWTPENVSEKSENPLDEWILSELGALVKTVNFALERFKIDAATRDFPEFFDKLTNFYIRRSRRRFWKSEMSADKNAAFSTLFRVLREISKLIAPISPFLSEKIWQTLRGKNDEISVHLCDFPRATDFPENQHLRAEIAAVRKIISLGLSLRAAKKVGVRQPLSLMKIALPPAIAAEKIQKYFPEIADELNLKKIEIVDHFSDLAEKIAKPDARKIGPKFGKNVQKIIAEAKAGHFEILKNGNIRVENFELLPDEITIEFVGKKGLFVASDGGIVVAIDFEISDDLRREGFAREIIRHFQELRKSAKFEISDRILAAISPADFLNADLKKMIADEILAEKISENLKNPTAEKEISLDGKKIKIEISR